MSDESQEYSLAPGWIIFAAVMMFIVGAVDVIQGLAALFKESTYVITGGEQALLVTTSFTAWGWMLIIWGAILILSGASLIKARTWGRWFAIGAVVVNMIAQIAWFPAYPLWSLIALGLGVAVLYALTAGWDKVKADLGS